jgi:type IV fimbrial biogenesis protein FimT
MGQLILPSPGSLRRAARGFTMMELLATMAIVAILSAAAVPAMREFSVRTNVSTTTNDIVVALALARAEAVKRGNLVSVIANGGSWTNGWTVQVTNTAEVLSQREAVEPGYRVLGRATDVAAPADRVVFNPIGGAASAYDFSICRPTFAPGDAESRRIVVAVSGAVRSRRDTTSAPAGSCT